MELKFNSVEIFTTKNSYLISFNDKKKSKELYNQIYYVLYNEYPIDKSFDDIKKIAIIAMLFLKKNGSKIFNKLLKK